jgi:hypothetical protein
MRNTLNTRDAFVAGQFREHFLTFLCLCLLAPGLRGFAAAGTVTALKITSGGSGATTVVGRTPTPIGLVTLASGSYTSAATTLSSSSATINIPAESLATGRHPLAANLQLIPVIPCRVADTRNPAGTFGGPEPAAGTTTFIIPRRACNIPSIAVVCSLNQGDP